MAKYVTVQQVVDAIQVLKENLQALFDLGVSLDIRYEHGGKEFITGTVMTPSGPRSARDGDWVIKDVQGNLDVINPVAFDTMFYPADNKSAPVDAPPATTVVKAKRSAKK